MGAEQQLSPQDRQRLLREQDRQQKNAEARQLASGAAQTAMSQGEYAAPGYWEVIGSPDIERERFEDDEHLGEFVATEFSNRFALGNITRADYEKWQWAIENEFMTMRNEFKDNKCRLDDVDMATMGYGKMPELTNERARRLRSAMQAKKMHASLSVNARGLRSGTEIHAVARSEAGPEEEHDEGYLDRVKGWLGS